MVGRIQGYRRGTGRKQEGYRRVTGRIQEGYRRGTGGVQAVVAVFFFSKAIARTIALSKSTPLFIKSRQYKSLESIGVE